MREKILSIAYSLIGEASLGIHDAEMEIFYAKKKSQSECKKEIDENLLKLDIVSELMILLLKTNENDFENSLKDYIDIQLEQYSKEISSKDQLNLSIAYTRKKILDFFVNNFY